MKKVIVVLALASVAIGCQKIAAGGNKGVLSIEEGTERYSDDVKSDEATKQYYEKYGKKNMKSTDSAKTVAPVEAVVKKDSLVKTTETAVTPAP